MSEGQSPVRVEYRHTPLAAEADVHDSGKSVFVALAQPMPVRSMLRVIDAAGNERGLVVDRVIESADAGDFGDRGVVGHWVDADAVAKAAAVGSEHLESAEATPPSAEGSAADDGSDGGNAAVAMPAPVLVDDEDEEESSDGDAAEGDSAGDEESADGADASEGGDGDGAEEKPKGRRRRGGRRRR